MQSSFGQNHPQSRRGNSECSSATGQSLLTFVVAGGGFAGVETVAR